MFKEPIRNHPSVIFEKLAAFWGFIAVMLLSEGFSQFLEGKSRIFSVTYWRGFFYTLKSGDFSVLLSGAGLFLICVIVIVISFYVWRNTFFSIRDSVLVVDKKTLFKKVSKLPASNISTVNIERSLIERLIGTAKVKVDIHSSTTAEQTDFTFVLKLPLAELFKEELIKAKAGEENTQTAVPLISAFEESRADTIIKFGFSEVIRHQLLSIPFAQGLLALLTFLPAFLEDGRYSAGGTDQRIFLLWLLLIGAVFSVVKSVFKNWNFTLMKDGGNIYIKKGLIKTSSIAFGADKINGVIIKQSLLARIFGLYSIEAAVIGLTTQQEKTPVLSLLTTKSEAERVLKLCAPDYMTSSQLIPASKKSLVPYMIAAVFSSGVSAPLIFVPIQKTWISFIAIAIFSFILAYMSYRTKAIAFDERLVKIVSGILLRKTVLINFSDIQKIDIKSDFIVKRLGIARAAVSILSASAQRNHLTGYFDRALLDEIADRTVKAKDALSTVRRFSYEK